MFLLQILKSYKHFNNHNSLKINKMNSIFKNSNFIYFSEVQKLMMEAHEVQEELDSSQSVVISEF
jgi:hypothetical protein